VVADADGNLHGVAAVIDKDLASALLANNLGADLLIISTAVEKVALNFGTPEQTTVDHLTLAEAKAYLAEGVHFAAGSMGPKIQAVINYLSNGGTTAIVTNPENVARALHGETGPCSHWIDRRRPAILNGLFASPCSEAEPQGGAGTLRALDQYLAL